MELLKNEFALAVQILSSIWLRKPIILCCTSASQIIPLMNEILNFIPQYRQLIICGQAPKNLHWNQQKAKYINNVSLMTVRETLLNSFSEERAGKYIPLQLTYFNTTGKIFKSILQEIDRGWIALTPLSVDEVKKIIPCDQRQIVFSNEFQMTVIFENSENVVLESSILNKFKNRPDIAIFYLIQKAFAAIKSGGEALLHEIEAGRTIYPVEMQEYFEMNNTEFQKTLAIIEAERYLDISRFVKFPYAEIAVFLNHISQLDGIIWCCALQENHLVGMNRTKTFENLPLNSLPGFNIFIDRMTDFYQLGTINRLKIDLDDGHQLIFMNIQLKRKAEKFLLGILIGTGKYAVVLLNGIETILNEMR